MCEDALKPPDNNKIFIILFLVLVLVLLYAR
jgi:hypothetical protein